jgi:hypothetical protein
VLRELRSINPKAPQWQRDALDAAIRALSAQQPEAVAGDFDSWWRASKYCQVAAGQHRQVALDGWNAAWAEQPQGAVSDAMVEAACARFFGPSGAKGFPVDEMRAALTAALQVKP